MCKHSRAHNINHYFEAPSLSKVSLFKRTLTSVKDLGHINSTTHKQILQCIALPLKTSLNSPGGAFFMNPDAMRT